MSLGGAVNILAMVMAVALFVSCVVLLRPANGSRPLLVGFMFSSVFALIIAVTRVFSLQSTVRPWFGIILVIYLFLKLRALFSVATHDTWPFLKMARWCWRKAWGQE